MNRQQLPPNFRETGGVVVCSRETLNTGSRFGKHVGVIEVNKKESIDIDDYFDWWLAEKSLTRKCICFHVVGNHETGLGHVYRALTIADRLIDHDVWFLVNEDSFKLLTNMQIPLMPKGVEHRNCGTSISRSLKRMQIPLMPKGVEHASGR